MGASGAATFAEGDRVRLRRRCFALGCRLRLLQLANALLQLGARLVQLLVLLDGAVERAVEALHFAVLGGLGLLKLRLERGHLLRQLLEELLGGKQQPFHTLSALLELLVALQHHFVHLQLQLLFAMGNGVLEVGLVQESQLLILGFRRLAK